MGLLVLAGCGGLPPASGSAEPTLRTPAPPSPQPTYTPDDLSRFVDKAAGGTDPAGSDLDTQWSALFEALDLPGERPYQAPSAVLGFRAGDIPDTVCAQARNADRWRNNAAYCKGDQRIVYDEDWLRAIVQVVAETMQTKVGSEDPLAVARDAALAILAHEWGHHVQWLLDRNELDIAEELQADCFAGMYLSASGVLPHENAEAEANALDAAMGAFFELGNTTYRDSEWFAADQHGSPIQRIMATSTGLQSNQQIDETFVGGMEKGLPFCYGYLDYEIHDRVEIGGPGGYTFVELPGRASSSTDGAYLMEPETRTGQPGSTVEMKWFEALDDAFADPAVARAEEILPTQQIQAGVHGVTGLAVPYTQGSADGQDPRSGWYGVIVPSGSAGGLLIVVYQPRIGTTESDQLLIFEETRVTLAQVLSRLCTPEESADTAESNFSPVCSDVQ